MSTIKFIVLAIFAIAGFFLMFITPDSVWMDNHGFGPNYEVKPIYYWSIIAGAAMWLIDLYWIYKAFSKRQ